MQFSAAAKYSPPKKGFRTFVILWVTQSISVFGSALSFFAITIYCSQVLYPGADLKAQLAYALMLISLAYGLPNIISAPLAGAWADRHDRRQTMMAMNFISAAAGLAMVGLIYYHRLNLTQLAGLIVVASLAGSFHYSAFDSSYAMLVPDELLPRANGMMQTMNALSNIMAPAVAAAIISLPVLVGKAGIGGKFASELLSGVQNGALLVIALDSLTFIIAGVTLLFLMIPSPHRTDIYGEKGRTQTSIWADIREGTLYIWKRRPLLGLLGVFALINFSSAAFVLQPMLVKFNLAPDWTGRGFSFETALALLGTVSGIGGVAGGILMSTWGGLKRRRIYGVIVPILILSLIMLVYGHSPWLYLTAAMAFCCDAMLPVMNVHSQAIWQAQTPRELQGRVFAVRRLIAQFTWPVGTALAGAFGGFINPAWVFTILGLIAVVFTTALLLNPGLLQIEDKAYLDGLAG